MTANEAIEAIRAFRDFIDDQYHSEFNSHLVTIEQALADKDERIKVLERAKEIAYNTIGQFGENTLGRFESLVAQAESEVE